MYGKTAVKFQQSGELDENGGIFKNKTNTFTKFLSIFGVQYNSSTENRAAYPQFRIYEICPVLWDFHTYSTHQKGENTGD